MAPLNRISREDVSIQVTTKSDGVVHAWWQTAELMVQQLRQGILATFYV
jgi:hypothetical protein